MEIAKYLIEHGADVDAHGSFPLVWCAISGNLGTIKMLVKHGANIHAHSEQALRKAAAKGHLPIVKFLVSQGACIHAEDDEALKNSAENKHLRVVAYLIEQGADPGIAYEYGSDKLLRIAFAVWKTQTTFDADRYLAAKACAQL